MIVDRNAFASPFQAVEEVNRLLVLEKVNLAALVLLNPAVWCGDPVPSQCNNQNLRLRVQEPFHLLEGQLMCLGDLASAAVRADLKVRDGARPTTVGGVAETAPAEAPNRIDDEPHPCNQRDNKQYCD
jgi:hypothetical protein